LENDKEVDGPRQGGLVWAAGSNCWLIDGRSWWQSNCPCVVSSLGWSGPPLCAQAANCFSAADDDQPQRIALTRLPAFDGLHLMKGPGAGLSLLRARSDGSEDVDAPFRADRPVRRWRGLLCPRPGRSSCTVVSRPRPRGSAGRSSCHSPVGCRRWRSAGRRNNEKAPVAWPVRWSR
jgi:hypothetical protein